MVGIYGGEDGFVDFRRSLGRVNRVTVCTWKHSQGMVKECGITAPCSSNEDDSSMFLQK